MIARTHRFHGHGSLRFVYSRGKMVRGSLTSLKYIPNPKRSDYRLAIVVSKKVSKSAVVRNRIRRRLYEAFRRQEASFTGAYDLIVTVFSEQVATIPAEDVDKLVARHLRDAKIIP